MIKFVKCDCCKKETSDYIIEKDLGYVCKDCQTIIGRLGDLEPIDDIRKSNRAFICQSCHSVLPMSYLLMSKDGKFTCTTCAGKKSPIDSLRNLGTNQDPWALNGLAGLFGAIKNDNDPLLRDVLNNPYEGTKLIFVVMFSTRGDSKIKDRKVSPVSLHGYFELGDGGSDSSVYAGKFTHKELCDFIEKYNVLEGGDDYENDYEDDDYDLEVAFAFELNGWNYDYDEDVEYVMDEAGKEIEAYAKAHSSNLEEAKKGPWELMQKHEIPINELRTGIVEFGRNENPSGKRYFVKAYVVEPDIQDDIRYFNKDLNYEKARMMIARWWHTFEREAYIEYRKDNSDERDNWNNDRKPWYKAKDQTAIPSSELKGKFVKL